MRSVTSLPWPLFVSLTVSFLSETCVSSLRADTISRKLGLSPSCNKADGTTCHRHGMLQDTRVDYRPLLHYSPPTGFMNDPNGLVSADGEYHLFYQYDPYETLPGNVHWGHAVSRDLIRWETLPIAINETSAGQAFSGSAVLHDGVITAIYTRASRTKQVQEAASSTDGGRTFTPFDTNPVLDRNTDSFRDPQVFWHAPSNEWKMGVVISRQHGVLYYGSSDLVSWRELGSFDRYGILGVDYECPNLVELPVEGENKTKWVQFVSINPGAPLGGSGTQYFVGEFNGRAFEPDIPATRFADFGKDFYALQTYSNVPGLGFAWVNNWQYSNFTPTYPFRGVMSLPRRFALRPTDAGYILVQKPVGLDSLKRVPVGEDYVLPEGKPIEVYGFFEGELGSVVTMSLQNDAGERLDWGFDVDAGQVFIDRSQTRGMVQRFFTGQMADAVTPGTRGIDLRAIFDRCTLEVFAERGARSGTALVFFAEPPTNFTYHITGEGHLRDLSVSGLDFK